MATRKNLSQAERNTLMQTLQQRFEKNIHRHKGIAWKEVEGKLIKNETALLSLNAMEKSGGEPDVVGVDKKKGQYLIFDCAAESPAGRRSLCFDEEALDSRKENKPKGSVLGMAKDMGVQLLNEEQYRYLQSLVAVDQKTSSWIVTPEPIRQLGGALFGDYRYGTVFIYHNGASSYYAARGFRACITV